uniref:Uncharacterized protein n=1 Tax=Sipha flava TaxID=143950 RepID=A0A2S2R9V6_9HEMI
MCPRDKPPKPKNRKANEHGLCARWYNKTTHRRNGNVDLFGPGELLPPISHTGSERGTVFPPSRVRALSVRNALDVSSARGGGGRKKLRTVLFQELGRYVGKRSIAIKVYAFGHDGVVHTLQQCKGPTCQGRI